MLHGVVEDPLPGYTNGTTMKPTMTSCQQIRSREGAPIGAHLNRTDFSEGLVSHDVPIQEYAPRRRRWVIDEGVSTHG